MKKKVTISLCVVVLLCVMLSFGSVFAASSQRVYDQAGLFTAEEVTELEKRVAGHRESTNLDIVIVTTDNTMGKTSRDYADDFYDYNGFGVGDDHSGVLLLIDMDNRMAYMSTTGKAIQIFTDDTIQAITDRVASNLGNRAYAKGVRVFLDEVEDCVNPNIWGMVLGCLIIGIVGGAIAVASVWYKYTHGHKADQYELSENSSIYLAGREDVFLRRYVTSRNISSNNNSGGGGSSTHTSSSGTSHGGGGSSF